MAQRPILLLPRLDDAHEPTPAFRFARPWNRDLFAWVNRPNAFGRTCLLEFLLTLSFWPAGLLAVAFVNASIRSLMGHGPFVHTFASVLPRAVPIVTVVILISAVASVAVSFAQRTLKLANLRRGLCPFCLYPLPAPPTPDPLRLCPECGCSWNPAPPRPT